MAAPFSAWERSIAIRYLFTKRRHGGVTLVSVISFTAIALAVAALIITTSIMNGFRSELTAKMLGFNGHAFVVGGAMSPLQRNAAVRRIRALPGVVQALPVIESQALAQGPVAVSGVVVRGVDPQDLRRTPIIAGNIKQGSLSRFGIGEDGGDEILLGEGLAQTLGVGPGDPVTLISPSGGTTVLGALPPAKRYMVGGVFAVGMSQYDESFAYMPLAQAQLFFGRGDAVDFIEVTLKNPDKAPSMKAELGAAAGPGAVVTDWTERNRAYFGALQVEHSVMRMIFMFIVALAALNIISGLVMLVKNKSRDIAILRTMGAGRGAIMRIFFLAGASIGVGGTIAGLAFGLLFCLNIGAIQSFIEWVTGVQVFNADVYFLAHVPAKIDWAEVGGVCAWAIGAAFAFTLLPAWRASRLDPVDALRYE
ncbi:MAG TPA: lipoprotein-releasing ABC transporter permease subunit [Caulobacteraceae bacterium]|jgi:lipoprotein-releasing system permease protein|nr:lipoprotein-releasing ABC transporter permease subunit [Caulobacteraceae bacterium]